MFIDESELMRKLYDSYNSDKVLRELHKKQQILEMEIIERRKELGKKAGLIFDSLSDLVCKEHPKSRFEEIKPTYGNYLGKIYACKECGEKHSALDIRTKAYDCPVCGIVLGEYEKRHHNDIGLLCGSEGDDYHCKICGTKIGEHYWKFS